MAANTAPIYSRLPDIQWGTIDTANTAKDGTGTVVTVFIADATEGGRIEKVRARARGTNVATVLRLFLNNGATNATPANNSLLTEITLPATTLSEIAALTEQEATLGISLPPGYKILATIGTTVAAGVALTGIGGKY